MVLESALVSNRKGADLLAFMVLQRNLIDKDEKKNRGAYDIKQSDEEARKVATGKEIEAQKKLDDAKLKMGDQVLPMYTSALIQATEALKWFNEASEKHGTLVKVAVVGVAGLGVALVVLGPLLLAASGLATAYAATQLALAARTAAATAAIATQGTVAVTTTSKIGGLLKRIGLVMLAANVGDYVAGKFGIGGKAIDQAQDDENWKKATTWEKIQTSIPRTIETIGGLIGMTNFSNETQAARIKEETEYLKNRPLTKTGESLAVKPSGLKVPEMPPMRGAAANAVVPPVAQSNTYHITQLPGESSEALARRISQEQARQAAIAARGALTDKATQ